MTNLKFTAVYKKADEGGYVGYVVELPGANTQGKTLDETRENLKEAVSLLLECYREEAENLLDSLTKEELIFQAA
jgi:predicted RNase H-like HicB family nuclease